MNTPHTTTGYLLWHPVRKQFLQRNGHAWADHKHHSDECADMGILADWQSKQDKEIQECIILRATTTFEAAAV